MKKFLVIAIIFSLLTISAISAAETNNTDEIAISDNDLKIDEHCNDILLDSQENVITSQKGTFTELQNKINNASENSTVYLEKNYEFDQSIDSEIISFSKSLTIDGQGSVIDANNSKGIFFIHPNYGTESYPTVVLKNISFINGKDHAIDMDYDIKCSLINCSFINNSAFEGGAIYSHPRCSIEIVDCTFCNNSADGAGGAVYCYEGNCTVSNSTFISNNCGGDGGAINCYFCEDAHIANCTFNYNDAVNGGAISYTNGNSSIMKCTFNNNAALSKGGAIYLYGDNNIVENCDFYNNSADIGGGAIQGFSKICDISNSMFTNNSARSGVIDFAISNVIHITNCSLTESHGGAVVLSKPYWILNIYPKYYILNCNFTNNYAYNGGAISCGELDGFIESCNFISNAALRAYAPEYYTDEDITASCGGAIALMDYNYTNSIKNCQFLNNIAEGFGSAIYTGHNLNISYSTFSNNTAKGLRVTSHEIGYNPYFDYYFAKNYGNSSIFVESTWGEPTITINNCTGLINNDDLFKRKIYISPSTFSMTYQDGKNLIIKLYDKFKDPVKNKKILIKLNGKQYNKTTDKNGQVKLPINLIPGSYKAVVTYAGDNFNTKASKNIKITVKKATPTITAKKATFKVKTKIKKYTITMKVNGKIMKNTKVVLKVNKKTYSAKTNSKGKATFKINKLNKKGKYTTVVKYSGNKYYNTKSVKVYITVK